MPAASPHPHRPTQQVLAPPSVPTPASILYLADHIKRQLHNDNNEQWGGFHSRLSHFKKKSKKAAFPPKDTLRHASSPAGAPQPHGPRRVGVAGTLHNRKPISPDFDPSPAPCDAAGRPVTSV